MSTSLLLSCGLNTSKFPKYVHISEETNVDGSFLISSIIGQRVRTQYNGTLLVCLQHNYEHYNEVGSRLGYPLGMYINKTFFAVDVMHEIAANYSNSKWTTSSSDELIEHLLHVIQAKVEFLSKTCATVTVIIDNLVSLIDLGAFPTEIVKLCHKLNHFKANVTLVTKLNNCTIFDVIDNNLQTICNLNIRVIKLKSGHFKEVDGRLNIINKTLNGNFDAITTVKDILYKVDRKILIFNPGAIGISI